MAAKRCGWTDGVMNKVNRHLVIVNTTENMPGYIFTELQMIDTGIKQTRRALEPQEEGWLRAPAALRTIVSIVKELTFPAQWQ
jgi:hypothetical protein